MNSYNNWVLRKELVKQTIGIVIAIIGFFRIYFGYTKRTKIKFRFYWDCIKILIQLFYNLDHFKRYKLCSLHDWSFWF